MFSFFLSIFHLNHREEKFFCRIFQNPRNSEGSKNVDVDIDGGELHAKTKTKVKVGSRSAAEMMRCKAWGYAT